MKRLPVVLLFIPVLFISSINKKSDTEVIHSMFRAIEDIKSIEFTLKDYERVNGSLRVGEQDVKMTYKPLNIFVKVNAPEKDIEVLWKEGENHGKAYVHKKGVPIKMSLNPLGKKMRHGHHTIFELNLNYMKGVLSEFLEQDNTVKDIKITNGGTVTFDGKECMEMIIDNPHFKYRPYNVKAGESVIDISNKYHLSEYMILEKNKELKNYEDVKAGQTIQIPTSYAKKFVLYIDKSTYLPIVQMIYDDQGLFEKYEYYNVQINPSFSGKEFSKKSL